MITLMRSMPDDALRLRGGAVAERTADAYSWDAYGEREWRRLCVALVKAGLTDTAVEALVRSKHTRWSRDRAGRHKGTALDFMIHYVAMDLYRPGFWTTELETLVRETF